MTAQTTSRPAAPGFRVAPMIVAIIAILAFGAGLAFAQVVAPGTASTSTVATPVAAAPAAGSAVTVPTTGTRHGIFRNPSIDDRYPSDPPATAVARRALPEGRNR